MYGDISGGNKIEENLTEKYAYVEKLLRSNSGQEKAKEKERGGWRENEPHPMVTVEEGMDLYI